MEGATTSSPPPNCPFCPCGSRATLESEPASARLEFPIDLRYAGIRLSSSRSRLFLAFKLRPFQVLHRFIAGFRWENAY